MTKTILCLLLGLLCLLSCGKNGEGSGNTAAPTTEFPPTVQYCPKSTATLSWNKSTQRVNGAEMDISEVYGYIISWGTASHNDVGAYSDSLVVSNPNLEKFVVENLDSRKTYYFSIQTLDTDGLRSDYSNEASINLAQTPCTSTLALLAPKTEAECSEALDLTFKWDRTPNLTTHLQFAYGAKRGMPSDFIELGRDTRGYRISVKRGKTLYSKLLAYRNQTVIRESLEHQYRVLTCAELQKLREENPNFVEAQTIKMDI